MSEREEAVARDAEWMRVRDAIATQMRVMGYASTDDEDAALADAVMSARRSPAPSVREERAGELGWLTGDMLIDADACAKPRDGETFYDAVARELRNRALAARAEPVAAGTSATPVKCGGRWRTRIVGRSWGEWEHTDRQHVYESILRSHGFTSAGLEHEHVQFWMFPDAHPVPVAAGEPSEDTALLDALEANVREQDYGLSLAFIVDDTDGDGFYVGPEERIESHKAATLRMALRAALGARKGGG